MNATKHLLLGATALGLICGAGASAQPRGEVNGYRLHCQSISGTRDDIVGSPSRVLAAGGYSCRVDGGPMNGGVTTGSSLGEVQGDRYVGFSGSSVTRKPGSLLASVHGEFGQETIRDAQGKVTEVRGSGRGRYVLATGDAAPLSGKSYRYVTHWTGPHVFVVDVVAE